MIYDWRKGGRLAVLLWLLPEALGAAEARWALHLQFTAITVPAAEALPLIEAFDDPAQAPAAWEKTMAAVKAGRAELAGQLTAVSETGTIKQESGMTEFRFQTSFTPPVFPDVESPKQVAAVPKGVAEISLMTKEMDQSYHLGTELTAKFVMAPDGQRVALELDASQSHFAGWEKFTVGITPAGAKLTFQLPRIFRAQTNGNFSLTSGERLLFGTHTMEGTPRRVQLFFIKAWTTRG